MKTKVSIFRKFEFVWIVPFAVLVLVLPFNIVYHFNSQFAYIDGYFVNYLDFVVHIIDIVVVMILLWAIKDRAIIDRKVSQHRFFLTVSGLAVLMCGVHCLIFRDWVVVYFAVRLLMYIVAGVALYTAGGNSLQTADTAQPADTTQPANTVQVNRGLTIILLVLLLSAVVQSVIAILQFSLNRSLGLKVFGESIVQVGAFNASSVYLPDGFHLRGYGTFPHPNVLGGFLVISLSLILNEVVHVVASMKVKAGRKKKRSISIYKGILVFSVLIVMAGIFVTWSRVAWTLAVCQCVFWLGYLLKRSGRNIKIYGLVVVLLLGLFLSWMTLSAKNSGDDHNLSAAIRERLVTQSLPGDVSVNERGKLHVRAMEMMKKSLVTGVGMGRFISGLAEDPVYTESGIRLMQPVHNVFLLVLSEVGLIGIVPIAGFGILLWCKKVRLVKSSKSFNLSTSPLLFSLVAVLGFMGLFDHYLWSLPQGLAMWTLLPVVFLRIASPSPRTSPFPRISPFPRTPQ